MGYCRHVWCKAPLGSPAGGWRSSPVTEVAASFCFLVSGASCKCWGRWSRCTMSHKVLGFNMGRVVQEAKPVGVKSLLAVHL